MKKYLAGVAIVLVGAIAAYFFLGGGDPLAELLNSKWKPISVEQQQQKAIDSSAAILKMLPSANIAAGIDVKSIVNVAGPLLRQEGVQAIRLKGSEQLLRLEADFRRAFGPNDLPPDSNYRDLVTATKPDIQGTIALSLGISGTASDGQSATLKLKLLPAFNNLHIEKVVLAKKADANAVGDAVSFLLNRYAETVTAALNDISILEVSIPTTLPGLDDPSGAIKISIPNAPDVKVSVSAKPIKNPFRVAGVGVLVDDDRLAALAQLVPITDALPVAKIVSSTFAEMKRDMFAHLKDGLNVPELPNGVWVAMAKTLIADGLNTAFDQAKPCLSAQGPVPKQSFSTTVPLPDETTIKCDPTDKCDLQKDERNCRRPPDCHLNHDERDCHGLGKLICEGEKAAQNKIYEADYARCQAGAWIDDRQCEFEKGTQNGIYAANKAACETGKTAKKATCETAKEGLKRISRTGKVANIDVSMGGPANLKICFGKVTASADLRGISLALGVEGDADIATHVKFVPLDIVGHLACPAEWTDDRTIKATIPNQTIPVSVTLTARQTDGKEFYDGQVNDVTVKLHFNPSPTAILLRNANFTLACPPAAGLINAVTFNLAPLIPELLKDFDYKQKAINFSFAPQLPLVNVLKSKLAPSLSETSKAIMLIGTVSTPPPSL
ncbi:MAG: hypothetical protein HY852_13950 [Bradyrhizobium sp.]|uniref:hypothetical protein n=1 Tax=Bradyrhizobium sp. TaxID=376 RepID=UPI0025BF4A41|nr:hypothetical protein [Bradyrhizobium sp.]MBI5262912.1 hypothetical protein [Bradyrhizobium sp.]